MAKKKQSVLDFDNDPEVVEDDSAGNNPPVPPQDGEDKGNSKDNGANDSDNASASNSILSSVLSKSVKEPKKIYTGFYLEEPVVKAINKIVKNNKDTNKSKLVNDLLTEAFKQAGLL